jgi:FdhE protein
MNAPPWKRRIERAVELVETFPAAGELLNFYCRISTFQESIFESLRHSGRTDLNTVAGYLPDLCTLIETERPNALPGYASQVLEKGVADWEETLRRRWEDNRNGFTPDSAEEFLSRTLLQPYAEYLASRGEAPNEGEGTCPFCGSRPVVGVLRPEGEGARRSLICSLCATEWVYRRIVCPNCNEADKGKLPIYKAEGIGYVRVEACNSCHGYLKSVDLTINGLAVPVVDELATLALNLWAEETGYVKIETNRLGL